MVKYIQKIKRNLLALFCLFTSALALTSAIIIEYGLKILPCQMCIYERWPYFIIFLLSFIMLSAHRIKNIIFILIVLNCVIGIFFTTYHIGIELNIVHAPNSCTSSLSNINSLEDLYNKTVKNNKPSCNKQERIFDIPITYISLSYLLFMLFFIFIIKNYEQKKDIRTNNKS